MCIAGYVSVCVQLYCVGFHYLSLHVSAYMAIVKGVERASRQTHTQGNNRNNEGNQHRYKTQMENMQSVTT
jgi:hypothetical protein